MKPVIARIDYTSIKPDQDIKIINWQEIPLLGHATDTQLISFGPNTMGGNHKHPRAEWYIGFGDLVLYWLDDKGKRHRKHLNPKGKLLLVKIPPFLPHAVRNESSQPAMLLELAETTQANVERVKVF